ncbi:MAG: hypothetical protein M3Z03_01815 [Actinomycetota bacterium]|nr:hypothetical protein [Actinomycetota bacterium]
MAATVLTAEWLSLLAEAGGGLPELPGASGRLRHDVTGGPDGEINYVVTYADGRIAGTELGKVDDADGVFALTYKDAVNMALGDDHLLVAYMQGRAKYVGDVGRILDLTPVWQSEAHAELIAKAAQASKG